MNKNDKIKIIKHENPEPLKEYGDILYPFISWDTTLTADGWYTKFPEDFYENKPYYPLTAVGQNPWESLIRLGVNCFDFKESVQYECPYNKYIHFWSIPVVIFTDDVKFWLDRYQVTSREKYLDQERIKKFSPIKVKNSLSFTKVQRSLLGPGYTSGTAVTDGNGFLYDTLLALDNGDFLGTKVWMWFNK
jgi:hypothetical protein